MIEEEGLLAWPDAPERELLAGDLVDLAGLYDELARGDREIPTKPCDGVLVHDEVQVSGIIQRRLTCKRCGGIPSHELCQNLGLVAGSSCSNHVPRRGFLGSPATRWPGDSKQSAFAKWNQACPRIIGRVVLCGSMGPHDLQTYGRARGGLTEVSPLELGKIPPKAWKSIRNQFRRGGAVDMVVVYLPPPLRRVSFLAELLGPRGVVRSIVYPGEIAGMKCRELEVTDDDGNDWTFYEHAKR